jgi:RNA-directed DNA polymerase
MRPTSTIPWEKYRRFAEKLTKQLSSDYGANKMDLLESLNRQLAGWATFYQYTDFTATMFRKLDRIVFWKLGYWLARKYRRGFSSLMRNLVAAPEPGHAKTWVLEGRNSRGWYGAVALRRLVTSRKGQFRWRTPSKNPYIHHGTPHRTIETRFADVAFAMSNT